MKSFDSPGDVKRAFQFLRKKTWEEASPMDRAVFIAMLQDVPAAYGTHHVLTAPEIAADLFLWEWYLEPMDIGIAQPGSRSRSRFWDAGLKLPIEGRINGFYFVPKYLSLEFWSAARARKNGSYRYIEAAIRGKVIDGSIDLLNFPLRTIGVCNAGVKQRQNFIVGLNADSMTADSIAILFPTVLLPYQDSEFGLLRFEDATGLIAGDIVRITMEGHWFFSPRLIEEQTSSDD